MKLDLAILVSALCANPALALVAPTSDLARREPAEPIQIIDRDVDATSQELWKRRGGGGGGGRGGGSSGGGSSSGGSSGGSSGSGRGGSSGSGSSGSGSPGSSGSRTSPTYNGGGATKFGSGPKPAYGGGRYYGGGAAQPYRSGSRSPSGIAPFALGAGVGLLAVWPAVWLYGAYMYPYHNLYTYHNQSSDQDETRNVTCACDPYNVCGCDENTNTTYIDDLIGNGSYSSLNQSLITVATVNGTDYLLINGTLPNGTTAPGGTDDDESSAAGLRRLLEHAGWWPVVATVAATVFLA
ncbi:hypothetical protein QBC32DRAFT_42020 [Pseudoneurospora amorphoporcata]|uniref:DUF7732 domain-containing protein n=1 Tax=Pseudoneurospora amorphoporcata TaxID=241081 RepID=A0AAN6NSK1_9PEZI|nr:hypothetical protein QBC32DRAFT_42020 [Pseudoneurospora amorphoporcata]